MTVAICQVSLLVQIPNNDPVGGITEENFATKVGNIIKIERTDPALDWIKLGWMPAHCREIAAGPISNFGSSALEILRHPDIPVRRTSAS